MVPNTSVRKPDRRARAWTRADLDAGVGRALQPYDWIEQALRQLVRGGADTIRITALADALGVSRGSFYWHFKDRGELLEALVAHWRDTNTAAIVTVTRDARVLADGILGLFAAWITPAQFDPALDSAMRDWARNSKRLRHAVETADASRVAAISSLFERNGYSPKQAQVRARVLYFAQVGYYAMRGEESLVERMGFLEAYYEAFTGRDLNPALAKAFRDRYLR